MPEIIVNIFAVVGVVYTAILVAGSIMIVLEIKNAEVVSDEQ